MSHESERMVVGAKTKPKIAIVVDWLTVYAGAERVLEEMLRCFPSADVFAVVDFLSEGDRDFLQNKRVITTFIQKLPYAKKAYRFYLPLMPLAIEQLDITKYDIVISSSHAVAKGVLVGPDQLHISYVHSPLRYAWDMQNEYLRESGSERGVKSWLTRWLLHKLRLWDARTANGVDYFIANSRFIARRIQKAYRRHADVIYPPVTVEAFESSTEKEEFYLTVSRLVPYKRIDLIVDAFAGMPGRKLIVIGEGPEFAKLKQRATDNIQLLGYRSFDDVKHYMARAKAFVFAAQEDFGIAPVESQAAGTPVIAFGRGGAIETVCGLTCDKPTGLFFDEQTAASLCSAVDEFERKQHLFTAENCREHAAKFSAEVFAQQFSAFVMEKWAAFQKQITG